ncbi:hypothetical protein ACLFMI_18465 [Pseudonocardia nantongensis]|uniref:hypothetical protein n=1 Tax=Pseudonocardia nantongensis TaxID=1181885 RepID=UPI00397DFCD5
MLVDLGGGGDAVADESIPDLDDGGPLEGGAGGSADREVGIGADLGEPVLAEPAQASTTSSAASPISIRPVGVRGANTDRSASAAPPSTTTVTAAVMAGSRCDPASTTITVSAPRGVGSVLRT